MTVHWGRKLHCRREQGRLQHHSPYHWNIKASWFQHQQRSQRFTICWKWHCCHLCKRGSFGKFSIFPPHKSFMLTISQNISNQQTDRNTCRNHWNIKLGATSIAKISFSDQNFQDISVPFIQIKEKPTNIRIFYLILIIKFVIFETNPLPISPKLNLTNKVNWCGPLWIKHKKTKSSSALTSMQCQNFLW